jgi:hypothetical protein
MFWYERKMPDHRRSPQLARKIARRLPITASRKDGEIGESDLSLPAQSQNEALGVLVVGNGLQDRADDYCVSSSFRR